MSQAATRFDGYDLREELRPSALFDREAHRIKSESERPDDLPEPEEPGIIPKPVLDPLHGEIRVLSETVVQVFTDHDIYHELVEWMDEVFEIPRGYDVYWLDVSDYGPEPHALIVLREDDAVNEYLPETGVKVEHYYQRGEYAGERTTAMAIGGGVTNGGKTTSPTEAAQIADRGVRGEDARDVGYNGWTWWSIVGHDLTLDTLRG